MQMAALDIERWRVQQQQDGISAKWDDRLVTTDHERELYERARSAASEAEREGDAHLQAAVAAARVLNQPAVAPTQLKFWTLKFHCDRLESAYHRKSSTNSQFYDYIPVSLKTVLCVPHLLLVLAWLPNPSHLFSKRHWCGELRDLLPSTPPTIWCRQIQRGVCHWSFGKLPTSMSTSVTYLFESQPKAALTLAGLGCGLCGTRRQVGAVNSVGIPITIHSLSRTLLSGRLGVLHLAGLMRRMSTSDSGHHSLPSRFIMDIPMNSIVRLWRHGLSSTQRGFNLHHLWSVCAILPCVTILGIQLIWPRWYRSNRGTTLQRLVIFLWAWESLKVPLNANDTNSILMEVAFLNVFMSGLHRVPFSLHCQLRSYGSALQAVAILCKGVDITTRLQILCIAFIGHLVGLGLAYFLDLLARKQFLASLPAWLLDDLAGHPTQVQGYLSYRASLSRQLWSIFYPELLGSPQPSDKSVSNNQAAPRRALGGFAGGFGGVSSLKCTKPISSKISPPSSSSSMGGGSSDSSSDSWSGVGQSCFGIPCGQVLPTAQNVSGILTREPVQWDVATASSASSQVGPKHPQCPWPQSHGPAGGGMSGGYY